MTKDAQSLGQDGDRLDSWKKIAAYLGKDVRTALRWSKDRGMPIHRRPGGKRGAIYAYRSEIDEWIRSGRSEPPQSYQKTAFVWVGAGILLVLVTTILLLRMIPSVDHPDPPVERWVLVTDFDNRTGEERFDGTLESALRRELANSRHVLVVAPERIRDTLSLMQKEIGVAIDAGLGREICLRYGGQCTLITGQVEIVDSSYLLSLEVVDSSDLRTVASSAETVTGDSGVLPAVHRLSAWLRAQLGEELARTSLDGTQLEPVTTPSLRALELYSRGMQFMYLYKWTEAETLFRQAVKEDPEFASATLFVFWALNNQGKGFEAEAQAYLERAVELAGSASEQERIFIEGTYYGLAERNHVKACESFKILAELYPDHYWAAGNAAAACGNSLGYRDDYVDYIVQAAELRTDAQLGAAQSLTYLARDFDRARPYVERLGEIVASGGVPGWRSMATTVAFRQFFTAEELLANGLLPEVTSELQRIESALESMSPSQRPFTTFRLIHFYLSLGQFSKVRTLGQEKSTTGQLACWMAFLEGEQAVFAERVEDFHTRQQELIPDPSARLVRLLGWNMRGFTNGTQLDVLAPLFDPDAVDALTSSAEGQTQARYYFLSWPKFEAKLQLARGKHLLNQGRTEEAIALFRSGVSWFGEYGDWATYSYYFLGVELLAAALSEKGESLAAYSWLSQAADQRRLVNSFSAPLHQRVQAQQALLARELGRIAEAEAIEAELAAILGLADHDHPILVQIREQQELPFEIE
jgi:tetratricopeptide (TPR) repeat protein